MSDQSDNLTPAELIQTEERLMHRFSVLMSAPTFEWRQRMRGVVGFLAGVLTAATATGQVSNLAERQERLSAMYKRLVSMDVPIGRGVLPQRADFERDATRWFHSFLAVVVARRTVRDRVVG